MRVRLPALMISIGLLAGCADPAGAVRRDRANHPTPTPTAKAHAKPKAHKWWQAAGTTKSAAGLKVQAGPVRGGRITVVLTDVARHASKTLIASATPRKAKVGGVTVTRLRVAKSAKQGIVGVGFSYRTGRAG